MAQNWYPLDMVWCIRGYRYIYIVHCLGLVVVLNYEKNADRNVFNQTGEQKFLCG